MIAARESGKDLIQKPNLKKKGGRNHKMLLNLYILLIIAALSFFGIAHYIGSVINTDIKGMKKGASGIFLLVSMVLFIILALQSFNIETEYCGHCCIDYPYINDTNTTQEPDLPVASWSFNQTQGNTTYAMQINCITTRYSSQALAMLFSILALISATFMFYYFIKPE